MNYEGRGEKYNYKVEVVLNTFTRDYFPALMGPQHAERETFDEARIDCPLCSLR